MSTEAQIQTLFPGKDITLNSGEVISLKPFTFGQLPQALKLSQKISGIIYSLVKEGKLQDKTAMATAVMMVLTEGGEDIINLISLGVGKPRSWFDTLQSDDGLLLTLTFLEVNIDFFTKKMLPQLLEKMPANLLSKNQ